MVFSLFKPKKKKDLPLYFKGNKEAWDFALSVFPVENDSDLIAGDKYLARLSEDYQGLDHKNEPVAIQITTEESLCFAVLPKDLAEKYSKGTLIFYTPIQTETIYSISNIWIGVVDAVLEPIFHPKNGWKILKRFTTN